MSRCPMSRLADSVPPRPHTSTVRRTHGIDLTHPALRTIMPVTHRGKNRAYPLPPTRSGRPTDLIWQAGRLDPAARPASGEVSERLPRLRAWLPSHRWCAEPLGGFDAAFVPCDAAFAACGT